MENGKFLRPAFKGGNLAIGKRVVKDVKFTA